MKMNLSHKRVHFALLVVICGLIQACGSTPKGSADSSVADSLSKDNLDVLFATEFPVDSKEEALAKAAAARSENDADKMLFYFVRALQFDPTDAALLTRIGSVHVAQSNQRLAGRAFQFALRQDPDFAPALQGLGLLYFELDQPEKAEQTLQKAIASDDSLWRAQNVLGVLADRHGDYDIARQHYDRALEVRPGTPSVLINRGYSKSLAGDMQGAALDLYEVANKHDHPKAWRNLARVYGKQGWYEDAMQTFSKVTDEATASNETGAIALENGDYEVALTYLNEAVRLSPTYFQAAEDNLQEVRKKLR